MTLDGPIFPVQCIGPEELAVLAEQDRGDRPDLPTASVAPTNVVIGSGTVVGPHAAILEDVEIGDDCIIQAGTVIGSVGFEIKRTSRGPLSVIHDGIVRIGDRVEIGANIRIDKGFRDIPTIIEQEARIDNLVHVAHGVRVGPRAFVVAGLVIGGALSSMPMMAQHQCFGRTLRESWWKERSCRWVRSTKTVGPQMQVTGNFAIPHRQFLTLFKQWLRSTKEGS